MPVYEKTTGGSVYLRGIDRQVSVGDRVDVSGGFADYLDQRGDFQAVDVQDVDYDEVESDGDDTSEESGFDPDGFLERNVDPVVEDIEAGEADDYLDEVAEAATRVTVEDALGERRATLETQED